MNSSTENKPAKRYNNVLIHIALWGVIFVLPYFFMDRETLFSWERFSRSIPQMLSYILIFYVNYTFLIDRFLFKGKTTEFLLINLLIIFGVVFLMHFWNDFYNTFHAELQQRRRRRPPSTWLFFIRNSTSMMLMGGLSVALKMSDRWSKVENERKELEKAISEAELQNLKNQISPHFLLNTLNNIYALIEFNPTKAQTAVLDLSKMLRHLLYENNKTFVPLNQEVGFINNYFDLMRIRLSDNVKLTTKISIGGKSSTLISPLIFISLIENAFKHGVSGNEPSFIDISLNELPDGKVEFVTRNSYFPKSDSDKSGSGIGLELVKKRLDLLYPGKYTWTTDISDKTYTTILTIDTKKQQNDTQLLDS